MIFNRFAPSTLAMYLGLFFLLLSGCGKGPMGLTGVQGIQGATGPQGVPGQGLVFSSIPATSTQCPTGGTDVTITGATSNTYTVCNGATGAQGAAGSNGTDGTVITPVQFCSGVTPTYPSNFPEYGLCISNVMYGVYSTNGGFLAELPPGEYSSDGVNASCTFTIGANCQVTQ